jgi:hypothetical protein
MGFFKKLNSIFKYFLFYRIFAFNILALKNLWLAVDPECRHRAARLVGQPGKK